MQNIDQALWGLTKKNACILLGRFQWIYPNFDLIHDCSIQFLA